MIQSSKVEARKQGNGGLHNLSKSQAGFECKPDTEYTCSDCIALKPLKKGFGCALYGPAERVSPKQGGCTKFCHGANDQLPWLGIYTKLNTGYEEQPHGFSCKRCEYFGVSKADCLRVDKDSPGDSPGRIDSTTCCNVWEADAKRGQMATGPLMELIAKQQKPAA